MKHTLIYNLFLLFSLTSNCQYEIESNFGQNGTPYAFDANGSVDYWYDSTTGDDNQVYFTGWTTNPSTTMVLGSMNSDGQFNLNYAPLYNRIHSPTGTSSSNGYEIEMQSSDLPVVGGICIMQGADVSSLFMARFTPSGNLDASFGDLGYFFYAPVDRDCYLGEVIISPTDEIFMLGRVRAAGNGNFSQLIIKLTADGQLDESFADEGVLEFNTSSSNSYLSGGLLLENGQLLVAGRFNGAIRIFRINADGMIDEEFGVDEEEQGGQAGEIATSGLSEILAIKQYGDWYYAFSNGTGASSFIYKFNENGLDETYGTEGEIDLGYNGFHNDAWFTEDGKVLFTGSYLGVSYVTRADTSGVLDTGFFEGSQSSFEISENNVALYSTTQLSEGSLITSGQGIDLFSSGSGQDFVAYKLAENGIIDSIEEESSYSIKAFPNPVSDVLTILTDNKILLSKIEITDLSGRMLILEKPKNGSKHLIDLNTIESGMFTLKITLENGEVSSSLFLKN